MIEDVFDMYGEKIEAGCLLVTKENTGPNPGRIWLGVCAEVDGWLEFQSSNLRVRIWPQHCGKDGYWQVVYPPQGTRIITGCSKEDR